MWSFRWTSVFSFFLEMIELLSCDVSINLPQLSHHWVLTPKNLLLGGNDDKPKATTGSCESKEEMVEGAWRFRLSFNCQDILVCLREKLQWLNSHNKETKQIDIHTTCGVTKQGEMKWEERASWHNSSLTMVNGVEGRKKKLGLACLSRRFFPRKLLFFVSAGWLLSWFNFGESTTTRISLFVMMIPLLVDDK